MELGRWTQCLAKLVAIEATLGCGPRNGAAKEAGVDGLPSDTKADGIPDSVTDAVADAVTDAAIDSVADAIKDSTQDSVADVASDVPPGDLSADLQETESGGTDETGGCGLFSVGPGKDEPFLMTKDNASYVELDADGHLIYPPVTPAAKALWMANTGEDTVLRIDTVTGKQVGRYAVCDEPFGLATDLFGAAWVTCRKDGHAMKVELDKWRCVDKNTNGSIETSADSNGDGLVTGDEVLPADEDECVVLDIKPGGNSLFGVALDTDNHVWVADGKGKALIRLNFETGAVLQTVDLPIEPFGITVDWSWSHPAIYAIPAAGCTLVEVTPDSGEVAEYAVPSCDSNLYGISMDELDRLWLSESGPAGRLHRFSPEKETFDMVQLDPELGYPRGGGRLDRRLRLCGPSHTALCGRPIRLACQRLDADGRCDVAQRSERSHRAQRRGGRR